MDNSRGDAVQYRAPGTRLVSPSCGAKFAHLPSQPGALCSIAPGSYSCPLLSLSFFCACALPLLTLDPWNQSTIHCACLAMLPWEPHWPTRSWTFLPLFPFCLQECSAGKFGLICGKTHFSAAYSGVGGLVKNHDWELQLWLAKETTSVTIACSACLPIEKLGFQVRFHVRAHGLWVSGHESPVMPCNDMMTFALRTTWPLTPQQNTPDPQQSKYMQKRYEQLYFFYTFGPVVRHFGRIYLFLSVGRRAPNSYPLVTLAGPPWPPFLSCPFILGQLLPLLVLVCYRNCPSKWAWPWRCGKARRDRWVACWVQLFCKKATIPSTPPKKK